MADMKAWPRYWAIRKQFAKNKYNFSGVLKTPGDYIETYAMDDLDRRRIILAAHAWAYRKKYRVATEEIYIPEGKAVRITLTTKNRRRKDEDLYKYL